MKCQHESENPAQREKDKYWRGRTTITYSFHCSSERDSLKSRDRSIIDPNHHSFLNNTFFLYIGSILKYNWFQNFSGDGATTFQHQIIKNITVPGQIQLKYACQLFFVSYDSKANSRLDTYFYIYNLSTCDICIFNVCNRTNQATKNVVISACEHQIQHCSTSAKSE